MSRADYKQAPQHWRQRPLVSKVGPIKTCQWFLDWENRVKCEQPSQEGYSYCPTHKERCYIRKVPKKRKDSIGTPMMALADWKHGRELKAKKAAERAAKIRGLK